METLSYKTVSANSATVEKNWLLVDATGQTLGRFASRVAFLLRGKHKTNFTTHVDCGDNVIVINADKIDVTGAKLDQKSYVRHTGYPGGQRFESLSEMLQKHPERVIEKAVKGMLPHNRLGRAIYGNLRVYSGDAHKHQGQEPVVFDINLVK
ncbi:MAG: 50S ribosomal protein L13 [Flavobacteriales bacterium]|nr:50S ribosomal protein L13 [Flavobacteriales bacterium]